MARDDRHDDELVTRAAAMVLHGLKPALKAAIKDLRREFWRDVIDYLLRENWVRIVTALLFLASATYYYFRENAL